MNSQPAETPPDPYNARASVPETDDILARWAEMSKSAAESTDHDFDVETSGCPIDIYRPRSAHVRCPIVVFIHGGYWRGGSARDSGFLAPILSQLGFITVVPDYPLAPEVSLAEIVRSTSACISWILDNAGQLGGDSRRVGLVGHSAGGHLGAMALSDRADARKSGPAVFLGVSGLYDVVPVNRGYARDWLRLTDAEARELSPIRRTPPSSRVFLTVGEHESSAFKWQSENYDEFARASGCASSMEISPSRNHFDVIHRLLDVDDSLTRRFIACLRQADQYTRNH